MKTNRLLLNLILITMFQVTLLSRPLERYLEQLLESQIIPGFSLVVVHGDQVVFQRGYGLTYMGGSQSMTDHTLTAIGSLTKSFTAMAIMQLVEQGKINLDEPVITYLPFFETANRELSDRITVRMLLNNTSGLRAPKVRSSDTSEKAMENLVRSFESIYLVNDPGTSYKYSNEGFTLAGLLIEEVSGLSYNQYLEQHIFTPLQMDRTTNDPKDFKRLNVLYGHYQGIDRAIPVHSEDEMLLEFSPAGSLLRSTANDLGHYLIALLNNGKYGGNQILTPESIRLMWEPYSTFPGISKEEGGEGMPFYYGLGWFIGDLDGKQYIFHGGNRRSMSSMTFIAPDHNIAAALLANVDLTMVDRYSYPNLITIMNNVIRLSMNESLSDFAIPVVSDPTLNSYKLPWGEAENYLGEYRLASGSDWVYLGGVLTISRAKHGLKAEITKGDQVIEQFILDFVTRKTAVSRNSSMPQQLQFKLSAKGDISDLYIADRRYSKITDSYQKRYQLQNAMDQAVRFDFPTSWTINWEKSGFSGSMKNKAGETIHAKVFESEMDIETYFRELFPENLILRTGSLYNEIYGSSYWSEVAIRSSKENRIYQHLVCITRHKYLHYVIILTTRDNLTKTIAQVVPTFLSTFVWDP